MDARVRYIESEHRHGNCEFAVASLEGQAWSLFAQVHALAVSRLPAETRMMLLRATERLSFTPGHLTLFPQQRLGLPDGAMWLLRTIHPYLTFGNGMPVMFDQSALGQITLVSEASMEAEEGTPLVQVNLVHMAFDLEEVQAWNSPDPN